MKIVKKNENSLQSIKKEILEIIVGILFFGPMIAIVIYGFLKGS